MQGFEEALKKQTMRSLNTLADVVDQLENRPSFSKIGEHDELLCPKCEDLFKISGYKVTMVEVLAWKNCTIRAREK